MEGNCETCRWWACSTKENLGDCEKMASRNGKPIHPPSLAVAVVREEWYAWAETHATFGCVQWEGKA